MSGGTEGASFLLEEDNFKFLPKGDNSTDTQTFNSSQEKISPKEDNSTDAPTFNLSPAKFLPKGDNTADAQTFNSSPVRFLPKGDNSTDTQTFNSSLAKYLSQGDNLTDPQTFNSSPSKYLPLSSITTSSVNSNMTFVSTNFTKSTFPMPRSARPTSLSINSTKPQSLLKYQTKTTSNRLPAAPVYRPPKPSVNDKSGELPPLVEPSTRLCAQITEQAEYFFSDPMISKDSFLLKHVRKNKEGYVNIKLLISAYKPIKRLTTDWRQIAFAIRACSTRLHVNEAGTKVRRVEPLPPYYDSSTPSRTIVVTRFPSSLVSPSIKDVVSLFSSCGDIIQVRILRPGNPCSGHVKKYLSLHPEMTTKVCAFIEFEKLESAQMAVRELNKPGDLEIIEYVEPTSNERRDIDVTSIRKESQPIRDSKPQGNKLELKLSQMKVKDEEETVFTDEGIHVEEEEDEEDNVEWRDLVNKTIAFIYE